MKSNLYLHEELMLLALNDMQGTVHFGANLNFAVAGGVLAELVLQNRIEVDSSKRRKKGQLMDDTPFGDPFLDECLLKLSKLKKKRSLQDFFSRLTMIPKMKHKIAGTLVNKGILSMNEESFMLLFSRKLYPELNPEPERKLIARVEKVIESDDESIDARTAVIIALSDVTGILKPALGKDIVKRRKKRIKQIAKGNVVVEGAKEAVEAAQAAIIVATILPAVMVSTMAH